MFSIKSSFGDDFPYHSTKNGIKQWRKNEFYREERRGKRDSTLQKPAG
jgi:hypothetical protein